MRIVECSMMKFVYNTRAALLVEPRKCKLIFWTILIATAEGDGCLRFFAATDEKDAMEVSFFLSSF